MTRSLLLTVTVTLLLGASDRARADTTPDLSVLEGTWRRDDGWCYLLVSEGDRLVGWCLDEDEFGCRVDLLAESPDELFGSASFTRATEEGATLSAPWQLRRAGADRLVGRVEAIELDDEGNERGREWEEHRFRRVAPLSPAEAQAARRVALVQFTIDSTLAGGDLAELRRLLASPLVRDLGDLPWREVVARRLEAIKRRLSGGGPNPKDKLPPDMDGFLARFTGTSDGVTAALDAFAAPGIERHNMDWYDLREPSVTKHEPVDGHDRYTFEAKAGMTIRTYVVVWRGARIVAVEDLGMR
jgi:hypothetical protein